MYPNTPQERRVVKILKIFSTDVYGVTSPYPTVTIVTVE